jgi:hypothetical protein
MSSKLFVNIAVKNLNKSIEYFTKLGYTFNPKFTDETATCMLLNETTSNPSLPNPCVTPPKVMKLFLQYLSIAKKQ